MMKINMKRKPKAPITAAKIGEVRANEWGRVVLVTFVKVYGAGEYFKVLILREGPRGAAAKFSTIPQNFDDLGEIARLYPFVLDAQLNIEGHEEVPGL